MKTCEYRQEKGVYCARKKIAKEYTRLGGDAGFKAEYRGILEGNYTLSGLMAAIAFKGGRVDVNWSKDSQKQSRELKARNKVE